MKCVKWLGLGDLHRNRRRHVHRFRLSNQEFFFYRLASGAGGFGGRCVDGRIARRLDHKWGRASWLRQAGWRPRGGGGDIFNSPGGFVACIGAPIAGSHDCSGLFGKGSDRRWLGVLGRGFRRGRT